LVEHAEGVGERPGIETVLQEGRAVVAYLVDLRGRVAGLQVDPVHGFAADVVTGKRERGDLRPCHEVGRGADGARINEE
jgi:hypothetical protein